MALQILSAASVTQLVDALVTQLSSNHDGASARDPFARDIVVVPSSGMREYLIEHLCRSLPSERASGPLLANVEFIYPGEFNMRVLGHHRSSTDPWSASRLRWSLLAELERDPDLLPGYRTAQRRLGRAEKAAMLFEKYAAQRPSMLAAWADGQCTDGFSALDADRLETYGWQYTLWRRVREQLGTSPAEEVRTRSPQVEPGVRYWLFALEFFSPAKIALLAQLGGAPVSVFMLQGPAAKETLTIPGAAAGHAVARAGFEAGRFANPLNRSWATIAHESNALVGALAVAVGTRVERLTPPVGQSLLGQLQHTITADLERPEHFTFDATDHSVQVHLCHGATRQVQVLRDALLHLFNADPTLHPRDVLVHCLDLDTFAPLLEPLLEAGGIPVPVTIVDRSVTTRTAFETAIESLLVVLEQRCTLDEFRNLLSHAVLHRSVDLSLDEVMAFDELLPSLDVRWGLDAAHRERRGSSHDSDISTLRHAVDRLLLASLVEGAEGHEVLTGITPAGDIDGQTALAVGKVSVLLSALQSLAARCAGAHTLVEWSAVVRTVLDDLVRLDRDDEWMSGNLDALATQLAESAQRFPDVVVHEREFYALVRATMAGVAGRSKQWADAVRVATPETLRGVPARVIVMLGMDEQRMRKGGVDGDDLLVQTPHVGDRDPRNEQRLGLLTAICSASDALVVLADGHSVTDNAEIPAAMPLRELIDHVASIAGLPVNDRLPFVVRHARQATDVVNLGVRTDEPDKNVYEFVNGPFTFDAGAVPIAEKVLAAAGLADVTGLPGVLGAPTSDEVQRELRVRHLVRSITRPVEVYFEDRLRVRLPDEESSADDALELWPAGLGRHALGAGMLDAGLAETSLAEWWTTRRLEGGVPPAALGMLVHDDIAGVAEAILSCAAITGKTAVPHSVDLALDGFELHDTVHTIDDVVVAMSFSEWSPHMRIAPLVALAALTLSQPEVAWSARIVARGPKPKSKSKKAGAEAKVGAVAESFMLQGDDNDARVASAKEVLEFAAAMRARAVRSPIMLFERTAWYLGHAAITNAKEALRKDMRRPHFRWLFGEIDFDYFDATYDAVAALPSGSLEHGLPREGSPAVFRYSAALRELWATAVVVVESTVPKILEHTPRGSGAKATGKAAK